MAESVSDYKDRLEEKLAEIRQQVEDIQSSLASTQTVYCEELRESVRELDDIASDYNDAIEDNNNEDDDEDEEEEPHKPLLS